MARGAIDGNCLHRLMQSPHHLEAQALAKTHSLYLSNLTYMRPPPLNVALPDLLTMLDFTLIRASALEVIETKHKELLLGT